MTDNLFFKILVLLLQVVDFGFRAGVKYSQTAEGQREWRDVSDAYSKLSDSDMDAILSAFGENLENSAMYHPDKPNQENLVDLSASMHQSPEPERRW